MPVLTQAGVHEQGSFETGGYYDRKTIRGSSALMVASRKGMTGVLEKLVDAGAKAEMMDEVGGVHEARVLPTPLGAFGWRVSIEDCASHALHLP